MPVFVQNIWNRIVEWWLKFSARQKAMLISAVAVVIIAIGVLAYAVTRPTNLELVTANDAKEASQIAQYLNEAGIWYKQTNATLTFTIHEEDYNAAWMLLAQNDIPTNDYGFKIDDVVGGSFTTTEADKQKKWQVYLQDHLERGLEAQNNVEEARVSLSIPKDDGTLQASKEDTSVSVQLTLSDTMNHDQAAALAKGLATAVGNENAKEVTIIDTEGNILYSGGDELLMTASSAASSNMEVREAAEIYTKNKVKQVLATNENGAPVFDNVQASVTLDINFDKVTETEYRYWVEEGRSEGFIDSRSEKNSESENDVAGEPGTGSNDDTTYVLNDNGNSKSSSSEVVEDRLPNETITTREGNSGAINYETSYVSVVAKNNIVYDEDQMKKSGQLQGMTFAEFQAKNSEETKVEVDPDLVTVVSRATGIPEANVQIVAYDSPVFHASTGGRDWTDWLQIALAILIFLLLGFVTLMSFRKEKEEEVAEEVSVEELLRETQENMDELDDIGYNDKSEARVLIEKFVAERPEAVANLLRNWLNEDWGE